MAVRRALYNDWTEDEIRYLKENWPAMGYHTAEKLKDTHTLPAVRQKAKELKLKRAAGKNRWSEAEKTYLKKYYRKLGLLKVTEHLGRSQATVYAQAVHIGLTEKRSSEKDTTKKKT